MSTATAAPEVALPDHHEVINGQVVELPPTSAFASEIANRLRDYLSAYSTRTRRGRPRMGMQFRLPLPEDQTRNREPDVAFISFGRWPEDRPLPYRGSPVDVVPDLTVEVASPTDDAEDQLLKAHEYLRAGVEVVWVVYPRVRQLYAYTTVGTAPQLFTDADALICEAVLPGFSVPMAELFPIMADPPAPEGDE